jgi:aryl-alcohol dehydrogenase-like predicted oxidoreductase
VNAANLGYADLVRACEASLVRLRTDTIDLYQIHWANPLIPMEETCRALKDLERQGKIRAAAVCNFGVKDLAQASGYLNLVSNQLPYGLLTRAIEYEILPLMREKRMGAIVYSPLLHGLLTGKYKTADDVPEGIARTRHFSGKRPKTRHGEAGFEAETFQAIDAIRKIADKANMSMAHCALAWVQSKAEVACTLFGATLPGQVADNLRAVELRLPADVIVELDRVTAGLKEKLGHNADLWDSPSRIR